MLHLRGVEVRLNRERPGSDDSPGNRFGDSGLSRASDPDGYPFSVSTIAGLREIAFDSPVTLLVGENGSGKSTFLEALAVAIGCIMVGGSGDARADETLADVRPLAHAMRLRWTKRSNRGFFLRAEDFFNFAKRLATMKTELQQRLEDIDSEYESKSAYARSLARMPVQRELHEMQQMYDDGLLTRSHGESFLALFQARLKSGGLYLLDEPETPLSPARQLALIAMMKDMVDEDGQFIVATHSPILLAYPGATILSFDGGCIERVTYEDLEHVQLTKAFLNNPEQFLRRL